MELYQQKRAKENVADLFLSAIVRAKRARLIREDALHQIPHA